MILEQAGHTVVVATDQRTVEAACEQYSFDVVILDQCIPPIAKRLMASIIRQRYPSTRILELHLAYHDSSLRDADSWLEVPARVPQDLSERVTELAVLRKRSRAAV
jgi:PleD family two-component response regulator